MRKLVYLACALLAAGLPSGAQQSGKAAEKQAVRTLNVKLAYHGAGAVDEKHKIFVFLFDSPDFVEGGVMPIAARSAAAKDATVTFTDLTAATVYVAAAYDPTGGYDGESGPPPSGSSMGAYSKSTGELQPVQLEPGKPVQIELAFDDSNKLP